MFSIIVSWQSRELEEAAIATNCPEIAKFAMEFGSHSEGYEEKGCYHSLVCNSETSMVFVTPDFETALSLSQKAIDTVRKLGGERFALKSQLKRTLTRVDGTEDQLKNLRLLLEIVDSTQEELATSKKNCRQLIEKIKEAAGLIKATRSCNLEEIGPHLQRIRMDLEGFVKSFKQ